MYRRYTFKTLMGDKPKLSETNALKGTEKDDHLVFFITQVLTKDKHNGEDDDDKQNSH